MMIDSERLATRISAYIQQNLKGNTPFQTPSDFVCYIAFKESQKKP